MTGCPFRLRRDAISDCEEMPFTRHAFERVGTAILETKTRPGHQVLDRAGDEHLTALGECGHARADVNGDAAELIADDLAFAGVQTGVISSPGRRTLSAIAQPARTARAG